MSTPAATMTGDQLEALTGLTDRRIRQIAKLGYFPAPVRGVYQQTVTIRGLFKYYREDRHNSSAAMNDAKLQKLKAEAEMADIKLAETRDELAPIADVRSYLATLAAKFDQMLTQKIDIESPARLVGKDIVATRAECLVIHDEMRATVNTGIAQYGNSKNK